MPPIDVSLSSANLQSSVERGPVPSSSADRQRDDILSECPSKFLTIYARRHCAILIINMVSGMIYYNGVRSGIWSDHRSPPRRCDDHRQPSVRSESKRGRSSPPRQRHGNSPTRQKQRKRSRQHRGHGPSHNSELSSRLSDRRGTCDPCRGDYTALKLRHNPVGAHQEQSERPRRTPRSATTTHPPDETPTRLVEVSSGGSMKIHVDPVHSVDVGRQPVYHPQHYQVQHRHCIPDAFDAWCHYFQLLIEVGLHRGVHPPEAFACAQPEPGYEVNLKSAVLVFNDPVMFPSQEEIRRLRDLGYCIVLGVKPKVRVTAAHLDSRPTFY